MLSAAPRPTAAAAVVRWALAVLALLPGAVEAFGEAQKYLIVSAPATSRIAYLKLPSDNSAPTGGEALRFLVSSGLSVPQGIAVDSYRKKLYVADPDLGKLVGYDIRFSGDALVVGSQFTVAAGVEPRWVAVDGLGNVYFSDEATNRVQKVSAQNIESGNTTSDVIYDGSAVGAVSSPGGVAADNYFVYWLNKASGTSAGSLVRGLSTPGVAPTVPDVAVLANNAMKSYGVCAGLGHIFYTDEQSSVYAVPRSGGPAVTVSDAFAEPRGCVFDGEGTTYVADKQHNAVYQFAANARTYGTSTVTVTKAADFLGAFGVALFTKVVA